MKSTQSRIQDAAMRIFAERGVTQLTVSELSDEAGVARGTIYNNLGSPDALFEDVATRLASEMHERVTLSFVGIEDPAQRLANGVRHFVRRAHDEPLWGRFITRFAFNNRSLQGMFSGPPGADLQQGFVSGRYKIEPAMARSALALIGGATLAAMALVLDGHSTWRDAGTETAELILRALGIPGREARKIASTNLPELPPLP